MSRRHVESFCELEPFSTLYVAWRRAPTSRTVSGYQAIWPPENTREALFDAMKRKETFATTGPRMLVRFFGGWDFEAADATSRQPASQVIKGWRDAGGELHERIYDVAVSDGRAIGAEGRCTTTVGNTVYVEGASWTNTIGDTELAVAWTDPEFDSGERAFYYLLADGNRQNVHPREVVRVRSLFTAPVGGSLS